jgi:hypothetical protein
VKTVRNILEESSIEDRTKKKKRSTSSSSEPPKTTKRKYKVKVVRITGGSNVEERRVLTERGEDDVDEGDVNDDEENPSDNGEDRERAEYTQNPPSSKTQRTHS